MRNLVVKNKNKNRISAEIFTNSVIWGTAEGGAMRQVSRGDWKQFTATEAGAMNE